ncbi:hypothetical protein CY34DRAFT_308277 [Suillus luteus UH-Slu-Lm8-n1]|uniref:Uncharacterized protein n=1 Tax=Suillus luteus UH-Slu-Lm8-n1 TaxID=930992 RepID=A0A0D0C2V0_9AGAM|nr:hypothetical protein CY34DRAFT_308277 [Suillus luteus UH-Slu-Lm8-n1]
MSPEMLRRTYLSPIRLPMMEDEAAPASWGIVRPGLDKPGALATWPSREGVPEAPWIAMMGQYQSNPEKALHSG